MSMLDIFPFIEACAGLAGTHWEVGIGVFVNDNSSRNPKVKKVFRMIVL